MKEEEKKYCGIVFIGGGSSWAWASTPEEAAEKASKACRKDWKSLYKFEKGRKLKVVILDMKDHEGWAADMRGIFDMDTGEKIPIHSVIEA